MTRCMGILGDVTDAGMACKTDDGERVELMRVDRLYLENGTVVESAVFRKKDGTVGSLPRSRVSGVFSPPQRRHRRDSRDPPWLPWALFGVLSIVMVVIVAAAFAIDFYMQNQSSLQFQ